MTATTHAIWVGGERSSLHASSSLQAANSVKQATQPIRVDDTYVVCCVRRQGNLSFSRVYQAGHYGIQQGKGKKCPLIQSIVFVSFWVLFQWRLLVRSSCGRCSTKTSQLGAMPLFDNHSTSGPASMWGKKYCRRLSRDAILLIRTLARKRHARM